MGVPREATIYGRIKRFVDVEDVYLTPGGFTWLHAIVSIRKKSGRDGKIAIKNAFEGHKSLKHVIVVDSEVDVRNYLDVERAIATNFQASRDITVIKRCKGSTLDPSASPEGFTSKMGLDATKK
jgi:UbiD family decarboxylase